LINNNNKNISIILPSNNIYIGITYNILLNQDLNLLNIYCEDNTETLDNYDKLKGALLITNNNNLYCKCVSSLTEKLDTNNINTNLSENVILKKIKLNNSNVYNSGLYKYGFIKIICSEYLNNKYIWNVEGNLIGNSILYSNTYLYNPFI
jgi:small-conductance mechanosensitive channel